MRAMGRRMLLAMMLVAVPALAMAQDAAEPVDGVRASAPPTQVAAAEPIAPSPATVQASDAAAIERLPASAFPEPRIRGIPHGSLWMTFHGHQWPYYPKTGIGISGSLWIDSGYEHIDRRNPAEQDINYWLQQGRLLLRATPTYSDGNFFVQGQAELVANKDQSLRQPDVVDVDDLWVKIGHWNKWDLQLGRYEGWEIYHFGMGLDLHTLERQGASSEAFSVPGIYGVTYGFYRPAGVGQAALHLYPTETVRVELGTQFGNEYGSNTLATRPVAVFDLGWLKLKAGGEYKLLSDQKVGSKGETESRGIGASAQVVMAPWGVEGGVSGAVGLVDRTLQDGTYDEKGSNTTWSVGVFANAAVPYVDNVVVGSGFNYTYLEDLHPDPALMRVQKFNHIQTFFAAQYLIAQQLYVKAVVAYANADYAPNFGAPVFENDMLSTRVRLFYAF
jgi:hypothetical protein